MNEWRNEVLQAEAAIRQLAEQLARAKGITETVAIVEQRLSEAAKALEQSHKAFENSQSAILEQSRSAIESVQSAKQSLQQASNELNQSAQALSSNVVRAINDFGEKVRQALQQIIENLKEQLATSKEDVNNLAQQNDQILRLTALHDAELKRLFKWLKFCLIFSALSTFTSIAILTLLLIK